MKFNKLLNAIDSNISCLDSVQDYYHPNKVHQSFSYILGKTIEHPCQWSGSF